VFTATVNLFGGGLDSTAMGGGFGPLGPGQQVTYNFDAEGKPNSDLALRNEFVFQADTCEVLKGWQTRYTAPQGNAVRDFKPPYGTSCISF
jgi:hypothetical protein